MSETEVFEKVILSQMTTFIENKILCDRNGIRTHKHSVRK